MKIPSLDSLDMKNTVVKIGSDFGHTLQATESTPRSHCEGCEERKRHLLHVPWLQLSSCGIGSGNGVSYRYTVYPKDWMLPMISWWTCCLDSWPMPWQSVPPTVMINERLEAFGPGFMACDFHPFTIYPRVEADDIIEDLALKHLEKHCPSIHESKQGV